ncbi:hypothetical protein FB446DRAFT_758972, partial [Lentinula raphanica]
SVPVTSKSQWLRVFDAWTAPLLKVYPHQKIELETYKSQIIEYFRSSPYDPSVAIRVDKEARQKAANTPFDLGNPESFHILLLKECSEPCPNNRKHGYCSECVEQHRAIDNQSCYDQLQKHCRESRKCSSRA